MPRRFLRSRRRTGVIAGLFVVAALVAGGSAVANATVQPAKETSAASAATDSLDARVKTELIYVVAMINFYRFYSKVPDITIVPGLASSAHSHNLVLAAGGCDDSNLAQCPGETTLNDRISAQGVQFKATGENVAFRRNVADNPDAIIKAIKEMSQEILNKGPGNSQYDARVSTKFSRIGVDVVRDSNGTLWLTEDFAD